jgi:hypothetical protein
MLVYTKISPSNLSASSFRMARQAVSKPKFHQHAMFGSCSDFQEQNNHLI